MNACRRSTELGRLVASLEHFSSPGRPTCTVRSLGSRNMDSECSKVDIDPMSALHKYVLRSNRVTIKEELELSVLDHLIQGGVFTLAHSDDIQAERTRRDKAGKLLDLLETRGSLAFSAFVSGLESTQKHLARMITDWVEAAGKMDADALKSFISAVDVTISNDIYRTVLPAHVESRVQSPSPTDRPIYDFGTSRNKGALFIINNRNFAAKMKLTTREASDVDAAKLYRVFKEFGFEIEVMQDLSASDMLDSILRAAWKAANSNASCFACAILSHGKEGVLYGTDRPVHTDDLIKTVCLVPGLVGKPKLFFLQAERGLPMEKGLEKNEEGYTLPSTADMLVCSSAAAGYASVYYAKEGGVFVNAIEDVFTKYGKKEDVLSLMTRVSDAVSKLTFDVDDPEMPFTERDVKQMPAFESSLTKTMYFTDQSDETTHL